MKVFISWSGERSRKVAEALRDWLPNVIQSVVPFMSAEDIDKGARWTIELAGELDDTQFGLICLTQENLGAPWLLFEAGALSKSVESSRVVPYLFNVPLSQLQGPLTQFQASIADKDSTRGVIKSINTASGENALDPSRIDDAFDTWWPRLEGSLKNIPETTENAAPNRGEREILEEILETVRQVSRQSSEELPEISKLLRNLRRRASYPQTLEPTTPVRRTVVSPSGETWTIAPSVLRNSELIRQIGLTSQPSESPTPSLDEEDE